MLKRIICEQISLSFVIFCEHSGKPRFWIYDCVNEKVLYRTLCSHGCGKGNRAWRAKISNAPGSNCSSVGMFRVMGFHKMRGKYPSLKLKGLSETNSNAERRGILIHSGVSSSLFKYGMFPFYIPLTIESQGCFAINNKIFQRLLDLSDDKQQKLLLYAYMETIYLKIPVLCMAILMQMHWLVSLCPLIIPFMVVGSL